MDNRIGIGYDLHRFVEGRKLVLGGVEIPYIKGLLGHSDADVLLHAITDAVLGALSLGDIGELFPDTDPEYKDADSAQLLISAYALVKEKGYRIVNVDTVIIAQEPALSPFKKKIAQTIAGILEVSSDRIGVKAKTNEGLGDVGKKEAICVYAVVLLEMKGA